MVVGGVGGEKLDGGLEVYVVRAADEKFGEALLEGIEFFRAFEAMLAIMRGDFGGTSGGLSLLEDHLSTAGDLEIGCGGGCRIWSACEAEPFGERDISGLVDSGIAEHGNDSALPFMGQTMFGNEPSSLFLSKGAGISVNAAAPTWY
jgi:hypothetical protein